MVKIEKLVKQEFELIVGEHKFQQKLLAKDYYITVLLYFLKDIKGMYFKGGTALNKTILNYARISEDIDFTLDRPVKDVKKEIIETITASHMFGGITQDKDVEKFTRLIVSYHADFADGTIFIDLNERGKLLTKPEQIQIRHFYPNIPKFSVPCLSQDEMVAEKMAAAIGRNKPRDHYDLYHIIKRKIPIRLTLVKKKCQQSGDEFNIIKMFNKAQTLYKRWNEDLEPLIVEEITFQEVMQTLAKHFNLKNEKEKLKK